MKPSDVTERLVEIAERLMSKQADHVFVGKDYTKHDLIVDLLALAETIRKRTNG